MLTGLGMLINVTFFRQKIKDYLDKATTESILEDLRKILVHRLRESQRLQSTFDSHCAEDSSQIRYWNEDSFGKYLKSIHPDAAFSEAAVQLLWRCFHFYAYHPFPRDATMGKIDYNGFQRAILLLAAQCTDLLGTEELDWFWRHDNAFFHKASFERIFRSIGRPDSTSKQSTQLDRHSTSILNDAMDVLAMTQPLTMPLIPSPDQLEPIAQRLLGEGPTQMQYQVTRRELSILLSLLLRLRLRKAKWGYPWFHIGSFDKADTDDKELAEADILVNELGGDQMDQDLTTGQLLKAMDLLPNLQLRFHQLWAVLFQSPMTAVDDALSEEPGAISSRVLGAISLFIPQPLVSSRIYETMLQDMRISLEQSIQPSNNEYNMTVTRLIKSLGEDPHPHLVLLTGEKTATTPATVLGAYFPGPLWVKADGGEEKRKVKAGASHLLFQLGPRFRLLRWTSPGVPLTDIINTDDSILPLEAIASSDDTSPASNKPYSIGDPEIKGVGLRIDPEAKIATLTSNSTDADSGDIAWYKDVCMDGDNGDTTINGKWQVIIKLDRLDIFNVSGGLDKDLGVGRITSAKDHARHVQESMEPKIKGEELRKRIQGFGST